MKINNKHIIYLELVSIMMFNENFWENNVIENS